MSMRLKVSDLETLTQQLKTLEASGLDVTKIKVTDHEVWVERHDDQKDGVWYEVRGISDKLSTGLLSTRS